jgi:ketosteroid isomerase-like protein
MKRIFFTLMTLALASFLMACGDSAANNSANKPANVVAANANAAKPAVDQEAVKAEVRKVMEGIKAGLSKNDADAMDKIYADDYKITYPDGTSMNKTERLAAIRSGAIKYTSFEFAEQSITVNPDGNGATGVFKITTKGTMKGKPMDPEVLTTGVFAKTPAGWRLMSASNAKFPAGVAKTDDASKMNEAQKKTGDPKVDAVAGDDVPPPKKK